MPPPQSVKNEWKTRRRFNLSIYLCLNREYCLHNGLRLLICSRHPLSASPRPGTYCYLSSMKRKSPLQSALSVLRLGLFLLLFTAQSVCAQKTVFVLSSGGPDTFRTKEQAFQQYLKDADYAGLDKSSQTSGLAVTTHVPRLIEPPHQSFGDMAYSVEVKRTSKHEDGTTTVDTWTDVDVIKAITRETENDPPAATDKHTGKAPDSTVHSLQPLGRGHTGRTAPANHCEDLAMREALADPARGAVVMKSMGDTRWRGWSKMQLTHTCPDGKKVVIHYVGEFEQGVLRHVDDFKFKDN